MQIYRGEGPRPCHRDIMPRVIVSERMRRRIDAFLDPVIAKQPELQDLTAGSDVTTAIDAVATSVSASSPASPQHSLNLDKDE